MTVIIREGRREDAAKAHALIHALAVHENAEPDLKITVDAFEAAAFSAPLRMGFMVAELDGEIVGVVTYVQRFHIWNNSDIFQLDDLYVSPTARGHGVGSLLLDALGAKAKAIGAGVKWEVNADNEGAIRLYKRIGARVTEKGVCWWPPENIPG
ncbi:MULTISPECIES: GNAT family N-acetyltransferase [Kordiimonas]|jgi:ribosomal protein S18 acetylase RimI-like enzyme|uniref:GNAT family N-acetyltransferase n=1 Tax=Kordiimonas TaxID=288021 RepID=UPI00257E8745|nr:GNAT family N-acetyltransferase [Kordiimonas sp. UBA4487]